MNTIMSLITLVIVAAHLAVLIIARPRPAAQQAIITPGGFNWLVAAVLASAAAVTTYLLPGDLTFVEITARGPLLTLLLIVTVSCFGALMLREITPADSRFARTRDWLILCGVWLLATAATVILLDTPNVGTSGWLVDNFTNPDTSAILTIAGWFIVVLILSIVALYRFYVARLPEAANRALFWVIEASTLLLGWAMVASGTDAVAIPGMVLMLTAFVGAAYAIKSHRVFDIRSALLLAVRTLTFVLAGSVTVFAALYLVLRTDLTSDPEGLLAIGALALLAASLYVPLRQVTDWLFNQLTARGKPDTAQITREFSRIITEVMELDALVPATTGAINRLLRVRSSSIILLSETSEKSIGLLVRSPNSPLDGLTGRMALDSPIYETLARERRPLTQFDIASAPRYQAAPLAERQFLNSLSMSAYAPITLDQAMIGILAVGPRLNDTAFYPRDLDLLLTLAQQIGVALRNTRLVDDLQHLNKSMRSLNQRLKATNEQLSQMDSIKSDFVTIASHELRTPLAQVRGYTDIMDALNEQGMLNQAQTTNLINSLRKATERMEELIAAMLDVSQLDVNAMDLRFNQTSIEAVMRMAIEPLTDAIKQRKLTLSARGLRGLPSIQADLQRLVQAFRNVIVNAIKFTPDGGRIEISATLQEAQDDGEIDRILIRITDTGVGIEPTNLEMIFKKFFRAYDPSLHSTGTYKFLGAGPGLGLTITRGVIEGHGGRIWAESTGHDLQRFPGATFHISLPVITPEGARRVMTFDGPAADQALNNQQPRGTSAAMPVSTQEGNA
ncbi:MAG: ATP-binding protein [Chloroflexota bacterium]